MAEISLARIDDRLVHGQVVTKWIQGTKSNRVVIVDDAVAKNAFLVDVYQMAAPMGVKVSVKSAEQAGKEWAENQWGTGTVLALFKNPQAVQAACDSGLNISSLQVAGMGSATGKKVVFKTVSMSEDDVRSLKALGERGVRVYFQALPEDKPMDLESILKKHFKELA